MKSILFLRETTIPIHMQLSQKPKAFAQFLAEFLKFILNGKYFETKYDPHRFCISEITDFEHVFRYTSKKSCLRGHFDKQHGKRAEPLLKSTSKHLYHIHWSLPSQMTCKKSLFSIFQVLGHLVNKLPADEKYPSLNRDNWTIPIQMQFSQKEKTFAQFLAEFFKFVLNFKFFETKYAFLMHFWNLV